MEQTRELLRQELRLLLAGTNNVNETVEEIIAHVRWREKNVVEQIWLPHIQFVYLQRK